MWPGACNFIKKETLAQMFFCEFCEISKNTFSYRTPPVAPSVFTHQCIVKSFQIKYFEEKQSAFFSFPQIHFSRLWPGACNFIKKETLAQMFSCEFCEISKNTFSYRTPPVAPSVFTHECIVKSFQIKYFEEKQSAFFSFPQIPFSSIPNCGLGPATLFKKRLWHRCFPVNFAKFLRRSFLQNTSGGLLLEDYDLL